MTHETAPSGQKAASDGCCGGMGKDKAAAPAVAKPDAAALLVGKPSVAAKTGGSCCGGNAKAGHSKHDGQP